MNNLLLYRSETTNWDFGGSNLGNYTIQNRIIVIQGVVSLVAIPFKIELSRFRG